MLPDPAHGRTLGAPENGLAPIPLSNHINWPRRKPAASARWSQPHGGLRLGSAKALGQDPAESRGFLRLCPSARGKSLQQQTGWRREWDSNPRYLSVHTLSKRAPSAARPSLRTAKRNGGLLVYSPPAKPEPREMLAEREGFEPSVELPLRRFSKPVPSATRPPLRAVGKSSGILAEREGFEPSRRVNAWRFSRPLPSTTRPPLLSH